MRKIAIYRPGGYDRLKCEEHPDPHPNHEEVILDVQAIGVNYADTAVRMGLYKSARDLVGWPITPGFEVAGNVIEAGKNVTDMTPGTSVLAVTQFNGYSTRLAVPSRQVFAIPESLSIVEAAAFPAVYLTAYFALFELAHPQAGNRVLVHSAAGGAGGAMVQLLKVAGCEVVGVVGAAHKVAAARSHGADHVVDKSSHDLWPTVDRLAPGGFDIIADANGVATLRGSYNRLRKPGKLIVYGFHSMMPKRGGRPNWIRLAIDYIRTPRFNPFEMTGDNRSVLAFNLSTLFDRPELLEAAMGRLLGWLEEGKIKAPPVTTYAFERVGDAHRDIASGRTVGKLVLVP